MFLDYAKSSPETPCFKWWNKGRLYYTGHLIIAGAISFILYVTIFWTFQSRFNPNADITIFTIILQSIGFGVMLLIANLIYTIGPIFELLFFKENNATYRKIAFSSGYLFSIFLLLLIPITTLIIAIFYPHA
jgi:hypothetical protein